MCRWMLLDAGGAVVTSSSTSSGWHLRSRAKLAWVGCSVCRECAHAPPRHMRRTFTGSISQRGVSIIVYAHLPVKYAVYPQSVPYREGCVYYAVPSHLDVAEVGRAVELLQGAGVTADLRTSTQLSVTPPNNQ